MKSDIFVDKDTEDIVEVWEIEPEDDPFSIDDLCNSVEIKALSLIGRPKEKFIAWLLCQLNENYEILMSQREMAARSGFGYATVCRAMKELLEGNLLVKEGYGRYKIAPIKVFRGKNGRMYKVNYSKKIFKDERQKKKNKLFAKGVIERKRWRSSGMLPLNDNIIGVGSGNV